MELVNTPKQERSKGTQEKLLTALESLLEERVFEQISIRDIANRAGVSSGTLYRRFKNKEALLPVLYERYDQRLHTWALTIWDGQPGNLNLYQQVRHVVAEHVAFYKKHAPMLRTLYIHIRLNGELVLPSVTETRPHLYQEMLAPIWESLARSGSARLNEDTIRSFVLMLLTSVNERMLFGDYSPSALLAVDEELFTNELSLALYSYLTAKPFKQTK